ncbi:MAG: molecular chaperone DnaJ [Candidatus Buchananbacteria bacterium]
MAKDYYQTLGVNKSSSADEIRKAYYKLAHQHHPHKGGDEAKMKEINEAYGVLGNADKKAQYDKFGQTFDQARSQGGGAGFNDFSDFASAFGNQGQSGNYSFDFGDMGDLFGDLFGMGSRSKKSGKKQGSDIEAEMVISFFEAAFGTEKNISLNKDAVCKKCNGSGAEPGAKINTCKTCGGSGQVVRNIGFGIGLPSVCTDCGGSGKKAEKECSQCRGKGTVKETENIAVKIPAGIDNGQTIRLAGHGSAGQKGSSAGDLYLKIRVAPDSRFFRDGFEIKTKAEISFAQAALGGKIEIDSLDGKITLKIPEGTQSGKVFFLKGRGVPHLQSRGRGDQLVEVIVKTPTRLSKKQKEILKELDNEL